MKTIYPVLIALALGTATLMFGLSGVSDAVFGVDRSPDTVGSDVEQRANNSSVDSGVDSSAQSDGGLLGVVVTGTKTILSAAKMVLAIPLALQTLGFPRWFAYPLGIVAEVIVGIGVIQFLSGRVYR